MNRLLGLLLGMVSAAAVAMTVVPEDFAYGIDIHIPAQGAIYRVSLPEQVYRHATRTDLGDMRVFNGDRQVVPHMLRQAKQTRQIELSPVEPPFFPFYRDADPKSHSLSLHIKTDSRGAIVELDQDAASASDKQPAGYLFDLSQIDDKPSRLELAWPGESPDFLVPVKLQTSNDLIHWRTLGPETTLVNMHYAGHQLVKNEIEFPATNDRYLRLEAVSDKAFPELNAASLHFPSQTAEQSRQWFQIQARVSDQPGEYLFDIGGRFPVDRLSLKLPQRNTLINGTLLSRPDEASPWMYRARGNIYHLTINGTSLTNHDFQINGGGDRYWKLQVNNGQQLGKGVPELSIGWRPHELIFVAQGQPPYLMAFGSGTVETISFPVNALLNEIRQQHDDSLLTGAEVSRSYALGGPAALQPAAESLPWKQIILWLVLIGVVVLLASMAYRLYLQMQQGDPGISG
ncbi:MAG TPA: DUF3999 domain-containing protein [Desulfobacteraceae bacterium]|nr:DUF3999 domain-containing protein [Desulfobacteraceae bacterium]